MRCLAKQAKQRKLLETVEKTPITFYGGAKGGGKSKGLQLLMLLRRFKYSGSTGAIFRKTYPELEANHIRPLFQSFPGLRAYYQESKKLLTLPNGEKMKRKVAKPLREKHAKKCEHKITKADKKRALDCFWAAVKGFCYESIDHETELPTPALEVIRAISLVEALKYEESK
jgi:hypothetical protein